MKTGIELITEERIEQIQKHGHTIAKDLIINNHYQLSEAAGLLSTPDIEADLDVSAEECCPIDWDESIWKYMMGKPYKDRLIIAGALIAAELDRIQSQNVPN